MSMKVVLACDLGGTSFRAALVDTQGNTQAETVIAGFIPVDPQGRSECDAETWWTNLMEAADRLARAEPELFGRVEGIAICGFTRTQVLLNSAGQAIRPAISWKDTRAGSVAARLKAQLAHHPEAEHINAFHPLARLAWVAEQEQHHFQALDGVLEPKDWLNFRLTSQRASDPVSMARLSACAQPSAGPSPFQVVGLEPTVIPNTIDPWAQVAKVQSGLPGALGRLQGVPVFCASNDTWAGVTGLGAMRAGYAYNISGTTEVLGVVGPSAATAEGLMSVDWCGLWQLGGPSQNGADTAAWLMSVLGGAERGFEGVAQGIDHLTALPRHPQPALFLPYLQGERVPYWNPALRGAFIGLERQHTATDLAYAVLEGVAFLNRIVLERAEASLAQPVSEIRFGGGASSNPVWAQIKADICNRPVAVGHSKESGLLGAAIIAWTGTGYFSSLGAAQDQLATVATRYEPRPARRGAYDALFQLFKQSEAALAPISAGLVALSTETDALPGR